MRKGCGQGLVGGGCKFAAGAAIVAKCSIFSCEGGKLFFLFLQIFNLFSCGPGHQTPAEGCRGRFWIYQPRIKIAVFKKKTPTGVKLTLTVKNDVRAGFDTIDSVAEFESEFARSSEVTPEASTSFAAQVDKVRKQQNTIKVCFFSAGFQRGRYSEL